MSKKTLTIIISVFAVNVLLIVALVMFVVFGISKNNDKEKVYATPENIITTTEESKAPQQNPSKPNKNENKENNKNENKKEENKNENASSSNKPSKDASSVESSFGTSVVGGTNSESENGTIVNSDPDAIPVIPHYDGLTYGKKGDKIPGTNIYITDPDVAMDFIYYHRIQNYMYDKYNDKFKIYCGFYSGDDSGDKWTCQFYFKDNPKIRVIAMMAKYPDGSFYCYDDVDFSMVQYEIREVFTPKVESLYKNSLGFISVSVNDEIGTAGFCEVDEKFDGVFKTYKTLKQAFESKGKDVFISVTLNFNKTFEQMGNKNKVLADIYSIIKLGKDKKYSPISFKFDFSQGSNGMTIIEVNSYDVSSINSPKDLERFISVW